MRLIVCLVLLAVLWVTSAHPLLRFSLNKKRLKSVICDDHLHECPDGNTCCEMKSGGYGCCNKLNAVCCGDGIHCCSHGMVCDLASATCTWGKASTLNTALTKLYSVPTRSDGSRNKIRNNDELRNVICPNGNSQCADGETCCAVSGGDYKCCPELNGVCCSDQLHCCPEGYICDPPNCAKAGSRRLGITLAADVRDADSNMIMVTPSKPSFARFDGDGPSLKKVICPDKQRDCPDGYTCCPSSDGKYGCCSHIQAVCCTDGIHCCPKGTTCDLSSGTCVQTRGTGKATSMLRKKPSFLFNRRL